MFSKPIYWKSVVFLSEPFEVQDPGNLRNALISPGLSLRRDSAKNQ